MIEEIAQGRVRGFLHAASSPAGAIVLAHGAGSDSRSQLIVALATAFSEAGINALRIDLPFRQARAKGSPHPSTAYLDREGLREAVEFVRGNYPVFLGGHSYGGRQATMLASDDPSVADALLLLSYPLHPPGKPAQLRTGHFPAIRIPALFVHGSRDPFGSPEEVRTAVDLIPARHELRILEKAAHELKPAAKHPSEIVAALLHFSSPVV